ncbi:MAG: hypothetical protein QOF26_2132 [Baekduia sp.]|nr:hypothetical protein [Baekduia sp.]
MRSSRRSPASVPHLLVVLALAVAGVFGPVTGSAVAKDATKSTTTKSTTAKSAAAKKKAAAKRKAAAKKRKVASKTASCHVTRYCKPANVTTKPEPVVTTPAPTTTTPAPTPAPAPAPATIPAPDATTPVADTAAPPTTESIASGAGYAGLGGAIKPSATWRPYASSSPFNQVASSAATHPRSAQIVARSLSWSLPANLTAGSADTTDDYGHPVFYAQPSDPLVTLHATEAWGRATIEGMQIRVPAVARPAGGDDGHMTIVTPDGWEYDLWRAQRPANGQLNFAWGGRIRVDGNGLGADATAAKFGNLAGIIRPEELAAGQINHALFIVVKCTSNDTSFGYGTQPHRAGDMGSSYVYPAGKGGAACASTETDAPPMGARYVLAMTDAQIQALAVPQWKKTVLTALAHYGGYVGDTGGPGFGFQFESGTSYTSYGMADPFVTYAQQNNLPTWQGRYVYGMPNDVNWSKYLKVVTPPAA